MPRTKSHQHKFCKKSCSKCTNPRVILRPFLADSSGHGRYRFTSLPASASLFNRPDLSDIRLFVGNQNYYAHRLVLCAASEVFKHMLEEPWVESNQRELTLEEDEDCVNHFDRFLQYLYTGNIVISESYVVPIFMLADKYVVKPLYGECIKIIENGLKVYLVAKRKPDSIMYQYHISGNRSRFNKLMTATSTSEESSESETSDPDDVSPQRIHNIAHDPIPSHHSFADNIEPREGCSHSIGAEPGCSRLGEVTSPAVCLVPSEIFPLVTVIKLLIFCHDERITQAALYNLEARLSKQITAENYAIWNDLTHEVIVKMLKDDHFYCREFVLFKAVKSWLKFDRKRQSKDVMEELLSLVRYPVLSNEELYEVEKDLIFEACDQAKRLVHSAIRYQLFKNCPNASGEHWGGYHYKPRTARAEG